MGKRTPRNDDELKPHLDRHADTLRTMAKGTCGGRILAHGEIIEVSESV